MSSTQSTKQSSSMSGKTVPHGRFVWYDLMTTDPDAAQRFYTRLAGWGTEQWDGGNEPYTMWTNAGAPIGGTGPLSEHLIAQGAPPHWIPYVCVRSVDETLKQAEALGGRTLHPAADIPTVGRYGVLQDPQGAAIALFTPAADAPGHQGEPRVGDFSWHELATTDHQAAFDFYSTLFGWEKIDAFDMGNGWMYQMYGQGGAMYGGMYDKPAEMPAPPHWLCYVRVPDAEKAVEIVKELGGQVLNGPMEVPGGDIIAQCMDPQGAAFAVHATKT